MTRKEMLQLQVGDAVVCTGQILPLYEFVYQHKRRLVAYPFKHEKVLFVVGRQDRCEGTIEEYQFNTTKRITLLVCVDTVNLDKQAIGKFEVAPNQVLKKVNHKLYHSATRLEGGNNE